MKTTKHPILKVARERLFDAPHRYNGEFTKNLNAKSKLFVESLSLDKENSSLVLNADSICTDGLYLFKEGKIELSLPFYMVYRMLEHSKKINQNFGNRFLEGMVDNFKRKYEIGMPFNSTCKKMVTYSHNLDGKKLVLDAKELHESISEFTKFYHEFYK